MATENLSSEKVKLMKEKAIEHIENQIELLKQHKKDANEIASIVCSDDEALSNQWKDCADFCDSAYTKLDKVKNEFKDSIEKYIRKIEDLERKELEEMRKNLDQFKEKSDELQNIKI